PFPGSANEKRVLPAGKTTYCLPSTRKLIGAAYMLPPVWKCQRFLPVRALKAIKFPSESPAKTRPDAVESTPAEEGEKYLNSHLTVAVKGSIAFNAPKPRALSRWKAPPK